MGCFILRRIDENTTGTLPGLQENGSGRSPSLQGRFLKSDMEVRPSPRSCEDSRVP